MHIRILLSIICLLGWAAAWGQEASDRRIVPVISTKSHTEFSPTISADGRLLIYESDVNKKKGWQLFESRLDSLGIWSDPVPLRSINEKCSFLAGPSLSYDGNVLYYTAFIEGVTQSEDIFYSNRLDYTNWSEPKSLGAPINTAEDYEGFPSISADGKSLYFIRINYAKKQDELSKESCFIIYVSHLQPDGSWGEPQALPSPVNTGCERDPVILADNRTLIFSSIRPGGRGKYDVYESKKQENGSWSEPRALDFINSTENDQSPCISAAGNVIFFYSQKDIYSIGIPEQYRQYINIVVKGYVRSEKTKDPVKAEIHVKEVNSPNEFRHSTDQSSGSYTLVLSAGKRYTVQFSADGYLVETHHLNFEKIDKYREIKQNIHLKSEYVVHLSIHDTDTKKPVDAWLTINGPVTYRDSVRKSQYPIRLLLQAGKDYEFTAVAPSFPAVTEVWKFNPATAKPSMTHSINLIREKIQYVSDVTDITTKQKTKIKVYFSNENVDEVIIADAGDVVYLRKGDRYQVMTASDKGYFFSTTKVVAGKSEPGDDGTHVASMVIIPIEVGAQLTLENITFPTNSDVLNRGSLLELDRVVELMQTNPTLIIEISAHTDNVGTADNNLKLSRRRALSVVNYLTKHGADASRLKSTGYGKTKPVAPNDSEENRAKNRRVELHVLQFN